MNNNPDNNLDKFIIMKILQSKGITSFDEWNYNDINFYITELISSNESIYNIKINFSGGITETISLKEYKQFKRDITIDKLLDNNII